jgi:hypothetical protein
MPIRKMNIRDIAPFDYRVGRNIGSASIGLNIQTVPPGTFSSRRHRRLFQEEILIVMSGTGLLHHGQQRLPVGPGNAVCYLPGDPECEYPDHGVAFVEGLGAEIPLAHAIDSEWTEERRRR